MNILQDLTKFLHSLSVSLQLSMSLPATLLVFGVVWMLSPNTLAISEHWSNLGLAIITFSYLFYALNRPFIRLLEGYVWPEFPVLAELRELRRLKYYQAKIRLERCREEIVKLRDKRIQAYKNTSLTPQQKGEKYQEYDRQIEEYEKLKQQHQQNLERYVVHPDIILGTKFGHIMLKGELYPKYHYGMDIVTLWTRFLPTLKTNEFTPYLEEARAILDFLVNLIMVSIGLWVLSIFVFAWTGRIVVGSLIVLLPISIAIFYVAACISARRWGIRINTACDLYRYELHKALHLPPPTDQSLKAEREMWEAISDFIASTNPSEDGKFNYSKLFPTQVSGGSND